MYGKIFAQMYDGSLYGQWQALITFQQMIVLADPVGHVDMTPQAIAARTSIPLDIIQAGLQILEQPDPDSRTPDEDGRRIVRLSDHRTWGWRIVNHGHYRKLRSQEERREYMRTYMRSRRQQESTVNSALTSVSTSEPCQPIQYAVSRKQDTETTTPLPPANGNGAHAPNGTGKHLTLSRKAKALPSRSLSEVLTGLTEFLSDVDRQHELEANEAKAHEVMADIVFAYWAKMLKHEGAKIDPKRVEKIVKRFRAGDTVNELLFAIDGAKKDPNLMGQNEQSRRFDGISTIFRDREQVERLAELGGYRDGKVHRMAEKYLGMVA